MLAALMGTNPQSLCMPPSNTQLLSLNLLALAGIKDIWKLPAEPLTPNSRSSSRASICRRSRAAIMFNYLVTVGPSVAENRMPGDFVSNAGHPQHALFVAAAVVGTGAAVIY